MGSVSPSVSFCTLCDTLYLAFSLLASVSFSLNFATAKFCVVYMDICILQPVPYNMPYNMYFIASYGKMK